MTPNGEKWHHLAVKKISELLTEKTSKHDGDFFCFNCPFQQQKAYLNHMKEYAKIKIFAYNSMYTGAQCLSHRYLMVKKISTMYTEKTAT